MIKFTRHLTALAFTAVVSVALLAGAIGPASANGRALASAARIVA